MILSRMDRRLGEGVPDRRARADQLVGGARPPPSRQQRARARGHHLVRRLRRRLARVDDPAAARAPARSRPRCTSWPSAGGVLAGAAPDTAASRVRVRGGGRGRRARGAGGRVPDRRAGSARARRDGARLRRERHRRARLHARVHRHGARGLDQPPVPDARRTGRAAARPDPALARGAAALGAARRVDPDRPGDPRRAGAHARGADDSARGDELAGGAGRRPRHGAGARAACPRAGARGAARRPGRPSARCAASRCRHRRGSRRSWPSTARAPTRRSS